MVYVSTHEHATKTPLAFVRACTCTWQGVHVCYDEGGRGRVRTALILGGVNTSGCVYVYACVCMRVHARIRPGNGQGPCAKAPQKRLHPPYNHTGRQRFTPGQTEDHQRGDRRPDCMVRQSICCWVALHALRALDKKNVLGMRLLQHVSGDCDRPCKRIDRRKYKGHWASAVY
eukprot:1157991-Pelagomonas_calceolata.AAC.6